MNGSYQPRCVCGGDVGPARAGCEIVNVEEVRQHVRRRLDRFRADREQHPEPDSFVNRATRIIISELAAVDRLLFRCGVTLPRGRRPRKDRE